MIILIGEIYNQQHQILELVVLLNLCYLSFMNQPLYQIVWSFIQRVTQKNPFFRPFLQIPFIVVLVCGNIVTPYPFNFDFQNSPSMLQSGVWYLPTPHIQSYQKSPSQHQLLGNDSLPLPSLLSSFHYPSQIDPSLYVYFPWPCFLLNLNAPLYVYPPAQTIYPSPSIHPFLKSPLYAKAGVLISPLPLYTPFVKYPLYWLPFLKIKVPIPQNLSFLKLPSQDLNSDSFGKMQVPYPSLIFSFMPPVYILSSEYLTFPSWQLAFPSTNCPSIVRLLVLSNSYPSPQNTPFLNSPLQQLPFLNSYSPLPSSFPSEFTSPLYLSPSLYRISLTVLIPLFLNQLSAQSLCWVSNSRSKQLMSVYYINSQKN